MVLHYITLPTTSINSQYIKSDFEPTNSVEQFHISELASRLHFSYTKKQHKPTQLFRIQAEPLRLQPWMSCGSFANSSSSRHFGPHVDEQEAHQGKCNNMENVAGPILDNALVQSPNVVLHPCLCFDQCHLLSEQSRNQSNL